MRDNKACCVHTHSTVPVSVPPPVGNCGTHPPVLQTQTAWGTRTERVTELSEPVNPALRLQKRQSGTRSLPLHCQSHTSAYFIISIISSFSLLFVTILLPKFLKLSTYCVSWLLHSTFLRLSNPHTQTTVPFLTNPGIYFTCMPKDLPQRLNFWVFFTPNSYIHPAFAAILNKNCLPSRLLRVKFFSALNKASRKKFETSFTEFLT